MRLGKHEAESCNEAKNRKVLLQKVDGSVREAYGTLKENLIPATSGDNRKRMTQYRFTSILKGKNTDASRKRI